jgi:hypothetical protein
MDKPPIIEQTVERVDKRRVAIFRCGRSLSVFDDQGANVTVL